MNPQGDQLYDEAFVVAVWAVEDLTPVGGAKKEGVHEGHRVHVKRLDKKWTIMIRNKAYEEGDGVSEGLTGGPRDFTNFKHFWVSRVEVQVFSGEAPTPYTNWGEILEAAKLCIVTHTRRIATIRGRETKKQKCKAAEHAGGALTSNGGALQPPEVLAEVVRFTPE